jgi:hypothetical protein
MHAPDLADLLARIPKLRREEVNKEVRIRVHLVNPSDVSFGIGVITPAGSTSSRLPRQLPIAIR